MVEGGVRVKKPPWTCGLSSLKHLQTRVGVSVRWLSSVKMLFKWGLRTKTQRLGLGIWFRTGINSSIKNAKPSLLNIIYKQLCLFFFFPFSALTQFPIGTIKDSSDFYLISVSVCASTHTHTHTHPFVIFPDIPSLLARIISFLLQSHISCNFNAPCHTLFSSHGAHGAGHALTTAAFTHKHSSKYCTAAAVLAGWKVWKHLLSACCLTTPSSFSPLCVCFCACLPSPPKGAQSSKHFQLHSKTACNARPSENLSLELCTNTQNQPDFTIGVCRFLPISRHFISTMHFAALWLQISHPVKGAKEMTNGDCNVRFSAGWLTCSTHLSLMGAGSCITHKTVSKTAFRWR